MLLIPLNLSFLLEYLVSIHCFTIIFYKISLSLTFGVITVTLNVLQHSHKNKVF